MMQMTMVEFPQLMQKTSSLFMIMLLLTLHVMRLVGSLIVVSLFILYFKMTFFRNYTPRDFGRIKMGNDGLTKSQVMKMCVWR
jgi:hypothetical protein